MKEWGSIIKKKGHQHTILVADCYYLDGAGRQALKEMQVSFICSVASNRFHELVELVREKVTKPGEWAGQWNSQTSELFVHAWDTAEAIGKKYVLSSAFTQQQKRSSPYLIPAYDDYKVMFSLCDQFNRGLHDHTWPHRHGGGTRPGDLTCLFDFQFSCALQNAWNAYQCVHGHSEFFMTFCEELAKEMFTNAHL